MGYTERISEFNLAQATTVGPEVEGVEVEVPKAKVVSGGKKPAVQTTEGVKTK